ncbi:MAG: hypothetical protein AAF968_01330 [Pseudomonadota bacterium]
MVDAAHLEILLALMLGVALWAGWILRGIWEALGSRRHRAETEATIVAAEARAQEAEAALKDREVASVAVPPSPEATTSETDTTEAGARVHVPDDNPSTAR